MVAIRQRVTVQPGGIVEVRSPELAAGTAAEVIVLVESPQPGLTFPLTSFVGAGKGSFSTVQETDAYLRNERDVSDR